MSNPSELENPFPTKRPAHAVGESSEVGAREIALEVARVEMVRDVEDLQSDGGVVIQDAQTFADLCVEREKGRIPARLVSRANEVSFFVYNRHRKSGADVDEREDAEPSWQRDVAPEQVAVGCIPGERTPFVGTDHRVLDIPEIAVEVVQVSNGRRSGVRADDLIGTVELIPGGDLPLAIPGLAVAPKVQCCRTGGHRRIQHGFEVVVSLLVADAHEDVL